MCRYTHLYLLADNRHYPFYVWKNIFRRDESVKYLLVPLHCGAGLLLVYSLCELDIGHCGV